MDVQFKLAVFHTCRQLICISTSSSLLHIRLALQHNIGLGGAVVVALYTKAKPKNAVFGIVEGVGRQIILPS